MELLSDIYRDYCPEAANEENEFLANRTITFVQTDPALATREKPGILASPLAPGADRLC